MHKLMVLLLDGFGNLILLELSSISSTSRRFFACTPCGNFQPLLSVEFS
jgi:hypothetical protein